MEFRYLGRSGLKVSAISYGNWITHGSQVEEDAARSCVKRALDLGITSITLTVLVLSGIAIAGWSVLRSPVGRDARVDAQ